MGLMTRLSNGWNIAMNSFKVLRENKQLLIFPILSGVSLILIMASFFTAVLGFAGWNFDNIKETGSNRIIAYAVLLAFYIVNYFVVVFFNMALIHCTSLYFKGEEVTVRKGIDFSMSRLGSIFAWAVFAGTVGTILRVIQENVGTLGKIITGIVGVVWSVATFFVVPIIAYENLGPIDAFKRSSQMIKEKWGEGIGAGFSFGLINLVAIIAIVAIAFGIGYAIHPVAGIAVGLLCIMLLHAIVSAARTIFISQVYHGITGDPVEHFNQQMIDNLFVTKR
ncbi:MAG: DUF6159 family protein [Ferruginibacter sp.]